IFFFSSRRRHTRSKRDWSSDVCSSDLVGRALPLHGKSQEFESPQVHTVRFRRDSSRVPGKTALLRRAGLFCLGSQGDMEDYVERSEEHTSELQSRFDLVCRLLLEKKKH